MLVQLFAGVPLKARDLVLEPRHLFAKAFDPGALVGDLGALIGDDLVVRAPRSDHWRRYESVCRFDGKRRMADDRPMLPLADIALELACAIDEADLSQCCFALELESMVAGVKRSRLEIVGARIGVSSDAVRTVLDHYERRAKLMKAAAQVIRGLIRRPEVIEPQVCDGPQAYAPARVRLGHVENAVPG